MDLDFQYTFKKTVVNRPIVHEFDKVRQRDLWQVIGSLLVIAAILLVWAWERRELHNYARDMASLQQQREAVEAQNRDLRHAIEGLRSPGRIEAIAIGSMHLVHAGLDDTVIIERVVTPPAPPASIVAAVR
jgi:hypothetical protein